MDSFPNNPLLSGMPLAQRQLSGYQLLALGVRERQPYRPGPADEMRREKLTREANPPRKEPTQ